MSLMFKQSLNTRLTNFCPQREAQIRDNSLGIEKLTNYFRLLIEHTLRFVRTLSLTGPLRKVNALAYRFSEIFWQ